MTQRLLDQVLRFLSCRFRNMWRKNILLMFLLHTGNGQRSTNAFSRLLCIFRNIQRRTKWLDVGKYPGPHDSHTYHVFTFIHLNTWAKINYFTHSNNQGSMAGEDGWAEESSVNHSFSFFPLIASGWEARFLFDRLSLFCIYPTKKH